MKTKVICSLAFAAVLFALPRLQAASAGAAPTNALASALTNANPEATMAALFGDPVIAKGKGFEIKRTELDEVVTGLKSAALAHGQTIPPGQLTQIQGQMLNRLIQVQLLLQKATAADKADGVKKADLQMSNLLERAGSQAALDRQMKAVGMTLDELRSRIIQEATAQAVLTRELNVTVTDAEVTSFYNSHPADFEQPEMVHVRHILLMTVDPVTRTPLTTEQQQKKHKQMEDILKQVRDGEDFATLAKQYSEDPGSKVNGGEISPFARGQMMPEFEAAAFSLTNNQVSDIVTSSWGYHVIKLLDKTPSKKLTLADKVPPGDGTIAGKLRDYLTQQKAGKLAPAYLEELQNSSDVQIPDADLKAAATAAAAAAAAAANAPAELPDK